MIEIHCYNEREFLSTCTANTISEHNTAVTLTKCNSSIGHELDQFKETGNDVGQLYDVVSGPYQDYGDITTNWDCHESSSDNSAGVCFMPYSPDCCLGNGATHFEAKHIKRAISSFPSAEIPLKMVVGNHHSVQQKLTFSRHLLRKRCFRSTSRSSSGKMPCNNKSSKTKSEKKDTSEAKTVNKSDVLKVKSPSSNVAETTQPSVDEEDLSLGDRRQIANARERQRVSHLNEGFDKLRRVLPWMRRSRRVSKVDTLRGAIAYIKYLQQQVWARDLSVGCVDCLGAYCLPRPGRNFFLLSF